MYKRGSVWWSKIRYKGKIIQKSLETSDKRLARSIEAKIRVELAEGKYFDKPKADSISVKGLLEKYLEEHSKPNKKPKTYKDDIYFSKKILRYFGSMKLCEVSPRNISGFVRARRRDGVSDITIRHELVLLRHAYNLAIKEWELIEQSPFAKVQIPKDAKKRVRYLSGDEESGLFGVLPEWLMPIVVIARETGLRLSNITNLRWNQISLFNKTIIVENTKNGYPVGIPMSEKVTIVLKELKNGNGSHYVFEKDGKPLNRWYVSTSFRKACRKAGIENFRFHDLRHDFCSRLVQRGVDLYRVAALAGHKDIKMTQRYAHLCPENLRSAIDVL